MNQSIKIDTRSPNRLNYHWLLLISIDNNWLRNFMARGSVNMHLKSRAYYVSRAIRLHSFFPCFGNSLHFDGIVTKRLFPDFTCSRPLLVFEMVKQVELWTANVASRREENMRMRSKLPKIGAVPSNRACWSSLALTRKDYGASLKKKQSKCVVDVVFRSRFPSLLTANKKKHFSLFWD